MVQVALPASVPPVRARLLPPPSALTVPPQEVEGAGLAARNTPEGRVFAIARPVRLLALVLPSVMVIVEVAPAMMEVGEKAMAAVGGVSTLSTALAGLALEIDWLVVTPPEGIVLV